MNFKTVICYFSREVTRRYVVKTLSMDEDPRDKGIFRLKVGKRKKFKSEFFKFPMLPRRMSEDTKHIKAETRGESWRTLEATVV